MINLSFKFRAMTQAEKDFFLRHASKGLKENLCFEDILFLTAGQCFNPESAYCAVFYDKAMNVYSLLDLIFVENALGNYSWTETFFASLISHLLGLNSFKEEISGRTFCLEWKASKNALNAGEFDEVLAYFGGKQEVVRAWDNDGSPIEATVLYSFEKKCDEAKNEYIWRIICTLHKNPEKNPESGFGGQIEKTFRLSKSKTGLPANILDVQSYCTHEFGLMEYAVIQRDTKPEFEKTESGFDLFFTDEDSGETGSDILFDENIELTCDELKVMRKYVRDSIKDKDNPLAQLLELRRKERDARDEKECEAQNALRLESEKRFNENMAKLKEI